MKRLSTVWLHVLFAAGLGLLAAGMRADQVDDIVKAEMVRSKTPGVSIAVIRNGKLIKACGYGFADLDRKVPAGEKTVYELGSITKQFTSAAVMMLVEAGKVRLDDKIVELLPDLPKAWSGVTVRHLLTHTSGIKGYTELPNFMSLTMKDATHAEVIKSVAGLPLQFQPGEKWSYSNTGYFLLGMLIEKVTGKTYGAFVQERIFGPLGMTATHVNDLAAKIPDRATGYSGNAGSVHKSFQISMTWPFSAGVLVSTVTDMAKWDAAVGTTRLLKKSSWDQIWTPVKLNNGTTHPYGFGWAIGNENGHKLIEHGGGIPGFTTDIARYPDDGLTVVVLTNADFGNPGRLRQAIARHYVQALSPSVVAVPDNEPKVTALVRSILEQTAAGTLKENLFTSEMAALVFPDKVKNAGSMVSRQGAIQKVTLVGRKVTGDLRTYNYVVEFASATLRVTMTLNKEEKISGLQLTPE